MKKQSLDLARGFPPPEPKPEPTKLSTVRVCLSGIRFVIAFALLTAPTPIQSQGLKIWRRNMNFENGENWVGFLGNCGGNIFSFPSSMDTGVITLPRSFLGKQIILPSSGYLVFQQGFTTFSDLNSTSCQSREGVFTRRKPGDWFDPSNWIDDMEGNNKAMAHVERVPCQFQAVKFQENSTFFLTISENVKIRKFFLGNESLRYADLAIFMSTELGKIQFQKKPETIFQVEDQVDCGNGINCICQNYQEPLQRKICSLVTTCDETEEECSNPITPHGFCCPLCGFHIKIKHKDQFSIKNLRAKLQSISQLATLGVHNYATAYKTNGAHIVLVPPSNATAQTYQIAQDLKIFLLSDSQVVDVSISKSWESLQDPSASASTGISGVSIFIIFIVLLAAGGAFVWFGVYKRPLPTMGNLSSFTLPSPSSWCPSCPTLDMSSVLRPSESTPSFAFARFANERISQLNLNSAFERAEAVDTEVANTSSTEEPMKLNVTSQPVTAEFANAIYGVTDSDSSKPSTSASATEHVYDLIEVSDDSSAILSTSDPVGPPLEKIEE